MSFVGQLGWAGGGGGDGGGGWLRYAEGGGGGGGGGQRWPAEQWLILQTRQSLDLYLLTEQFVTSSLQMYVF